MKAIKQGKIETLEIPYNGFRYNAQVLTSIDNGKTWYYSGIGKWCKTREEATEYIKGEM